MSDQQAGMASQAHQPFADRLARAKAKGVTLATRIHLPEAAAASFRLDGVERALRRLDIPVRVLTSQPPADGPKPEDPQGVSVSRWPVLRDKSGYLRGYVPYMSFDLPLFGRLLAAKKPAVLLVEPPPTTGVVVRAVTTLRRIPYVWYAPDVWSDATVSTGVSPAVAKAVQLMESFAMRGAKAVIAVNDGVAIRARQLGARRVEVVNNGIDTDRFTPVSGHIGAAHGVTGPYFIYAGTASEWQGADIFMEAFKQVRAQVPQAQLVFIGKGSHWPVLTELAEQINDACSAQTPAALVLPPQDPRSAAAWQSDAVVALVSIKPGQGYDFAYPTKVLSALACATPVIYAGLGPVVKEVRSQDLGWAVDYRVDEVAQAMLAALKRAQSPQTPKWRQQLRKWVVENRSQRAAADAVARVIVDVIR